MSGPVISRIRVFVRVTEHTVEEKIYDRAVGCWDSETDCYRIYGYGDGNDPWIEDFTVEFPRHVVVQTIKSKVGR